MPSSGEPATSFHKVQESSSAVSRSKTTASYFTHACRLAAHAVEQVEHALAPGMDRIVLLQQLQRGGDARPQEGAGQGVVGIGRLLAGQELLLLQDAPRRLEHGAEGGDSLFARLGLEAREVGGAQPLAARFEK